MKTKQLSSSLVANPAAPWAPAEFFAGGQARLITSQVGTPKDYPYQARQSLQTLIWQYTQTTTAP